MATVGGMPLNESFEYDENGNIINRKFRHKRFLNEELTDNEGRMDFLSEDTVFQIGWGGDIEDLEEYKALLAMFDGDIEEFNSSLH